MHAHRNFFPYNIVDYREARPVLLQEKVPVVTYKYCSLIVALALAVFQNSKVCMYMYLQRTVTVLGYDNDFTGREIKATWSLDGTCTFNYPYIHVHRVDSSRVNQV